MQISGKGTLAPASDPICVSMRRYIVLWAYSDAFKAIDRSLGISSGLKMVWVMSILNNLCVVSLIHGKRLQYKNQRLQVFFVI